MAAATATPSSIPSFSTTIWVQQLGESYKIARKFEKLVAKLETELAAKKAQFEKDTHNLTTKYENDTQKLKATYDAAIHNLTSKYTKVEEKLTADRNQAVALRDQAASERQRLVTLYESNLESRGVNRSVNHLYQQMVTNATFGDDPTKLEKLKKASSAAVTKAVSTLSAAQQTASAVSSKAASGAALAAAALGKGTSSVVSATQRQVGAAKNQMFAKAAALRKK